MQGYSDDEGYDYSDDEYGPTYGNVNGGGRGEYDDIFKPGYFNFVRSWTRPAPAAAPPGCDCGKPWVKLGGRHVCRYFGTFRCGCGHEWTSAYCWKGEKQNCRRCDAPRDPVELRPLASGGPRGGQGGHDRARCTMCQQLGRDCSRSLFI